MKEKQNRRAAVSPALVAEAKAGDQAAFAELYRQTNAELYRTVRSMVWDEDQTWDVLQDSYLRAWRGLDGLEAPEAFLPWLRRIAANTAATALAKKRPLTFTDLAVDEDEGEPELPDLSPENHPELALDRKETSRLVQEILAELPEEQQLIVGMRYYEDMPVRDIAETLGVAPGTVKAQLYKGRKKIEAGVRALEKQGVKLYGLSPLPFLLALLGRLEPAAQAEQKALSAVLSAAPAASGTAGAAGATAVNLTAMTAGQAFLHGLGAKLLAGGLAIAMLVGGGKLAYDAMNRDDEPSVGPELPSITETVDPDETPESLVTAPTERVISTDTPESLETVPTEDVTNTDSPESLVTEPTEPSGPPAEPTVLASGSFGLRQRDGQTDPNAELPYYRLVETDTGDLLFTNNVVEIRYDGSGVWRRALPDGEERLLFSLERTTENNYYLHGVTEDRLYFTCHNPDPDDWWGLTVFSVDHRGEDRQELGSNWDYFFGDGWTALRSFASDVRPTSARIYNRNDELVFEEPEERVWAMEAVDGALYVICVRESPKEGEDGEWSEDLIRIDPDGTQTVLMQSPTPSNQGDYGLEATISDGVIWIGGSESGLYDLYTLEPLKDRYDSSFYDDSLTWTLDSSGVLTISGSGVMGDCWPQPWEEYCETITAVVLEDGVTNVGSNAFSACTALTSVSIPDSVTRIGSNAFSQCAALTRVSIPDSVTYLGRAVFSSCTALTEVRLPAGLSRISDSLFSGCASLASLTIPDSVTAIGECAFSQCAALTRVSIPVGVTSVGKHAFWRCPNLSSVTVPDSVRSIGEEAFGWDYVIHDLNAEAWRVEGFTVCGAEGSAAQTYAEENGFNFVKVN